MHTLCCRMLDLSSHLNIKIIITIRKLPVVNNMSALNFSVNLSNFFNTVTFNVF